MGLIPDDVINEIRARADIVAIISEQIALRKAGRSHVGLCPFHNEKTPSFNVNPEKQFFYCFGCHKKGDVFTFVMEYEGKSFVEAAEKLAARAGIEIPVRRDDPALRQQRTQRAEMLEVNKLVTDFFVAMLNDPERGRIGRRYLEERGVGESVARDFQLGYAPDAWHLLGDFLGSRKVSPEIALSLGLVARQPRNRS